MINNYQYFDEPGHLHRVDRRRHLVSLESPKQFRIRQWRFFRIFFHTLKKLIGYQLDGHIAFEVELVGAIYLPHAAFADTLDPHPLAVDNRACGPIARVVRIHAHRWLLVEVHFYNYFQFND
jgi:hypothetical protein